MFFNWKFLNISITFLTIIFVEATITQKDLYQIQREKMIQQQLIARGIYAKNIIESFRKVERHKFVLPGDKSRAYGDFPLMINENQTISQPYVVAFMTEQLALRRNDKVLEIGTGSGYQAAILAQLCDSVFTVEIFESLARQSQLLFQESGYKNILVKHGDGYQGWAEHAPFDAIIVTCAPSQIPEPLKKQLAEGGRMIIPVGPRSSQNLVLLKKKNGKIRQQKVLPVRFVPMIDSIGKKY